MGLQVMDSNKIDRSAFSIGSLHDGEDEKEYWKSKSPQERMQAIEIMREIIYGHDASAKRLSGFFEITEFKKD